ncbi:MAG: SH3 domain-containing protein [Leptolyngbya sp. LCM1.Bin17]|nr:MAG: SH3 domain-containing protein [Leptolyngbya sp. LCM1.Bin17]
MQRFFVGLSKLILGLVVAFTLLSFAGVATARYFMGRLSILPPKPLYGDELPTTPPPEVTDGGEVEPEVAPPPEVASEPEVAPPPEEFPETAAELDEGAYTAVVVQPIGLVMREGPGSEYPQIGGIDYNQELVVLEEPAEHDWIHVRVVANGQEGWVKAGNTRPRE